MKSKKIIQLSLVTGGVLGFSLSGCGSGSNNTSSAVNTQAQIQPNGTAVLPDGTKIKLANNIFSLDSNRALNTKINVSGSQTFNDLGLVAMPTNQSNSANLTALSSNTGKLQIGASSMPDNGFVNIVASNLPGSPIVGVSSVNVNSGSMIKASYIDMSATGAVALIQSQGYNAANVLIFGFADTSTSTVNNSYLNIIQNAINSESAGAVNLLSIGGATGEASTMTDTTAVISNIDTQIQSYNSRLKNGKINGVDLDLEGEFTADQIKTLAKGFSDKGYLVSVAPQVYKSSGTNVDSTNPTNLVLTSGYPNSAQSNYTPAIASGYVDYVFVQTYNTGNWTIDGYSESQVAFFPAVAKALNNSTQADCSAYINSTSSVCIPETSSVVVGTVANAAGANNNYNIFGVTAGTSYNQSTILAQLKLNIDSMIADTNTYKYFNGVMMWSLNTDYDPIDYGDNFAIVGEFSSEIYGATNGGTSGKYFIMQVSNTASSNTGSYPYVTATLVINDAYYEWGGLNSSGNDIALGANENKSWGTLASSQDSSTSSYVTDSSSLDVLLSNSSSFTVSKVLINTYSDANKTKKGTQYVCKDKLDVTTFEAGHSYNVMVNPNGACSL
ncbi:MAG: hypothetical protein PHC75_10310, partial [Burkholderiales bacterium]|nr:hypothetical protein [Burkholderiales bacterium]